MSKIDPYIFRAYDIRGIYKKNLDEEVMLKIGFVLGKKKKSFVVGQDIRKSGKKLAAALIKGLTASGAKVFYTGRASYGQVLFAGWHLKLYMALYVTASHLPPEWNGLKLHYGNGAPMLEEEIKRLRDEVMKLNAQGLKLTAKISKLKKININKEYSDYLLDKFSNIKNNGLKIVVDCGNGAMCLSAPQIFKKLGFMVSELYCNVDSNFSGRGSEPNSKALVDLKKKIKKEKADFGVAFDGDGDRAVIVDNKSRYLNGNEVGIILAKSLIKNSRDKKIIITVSCSMAFEKELEPLGVKVIRVPVGYTFVISGCEKHNTVLGIEESNHTVMPQYFLFDDALPVPLKIAEIILKENKKLSELVDEIKVYPFEEIVFDCPDEDKFQILEKLKKDFSKRYKNVDTIDGVKINFNYGWALVRVSNTSPVIRLYVEAINREKFEQLKQKFSEVIKKEIKKFQ
ncbi:MAG: phosphomannomutase/phosphoglucomutase [Minisyncoccales bacterium]